ncbi:unnamed protein product [Vitrella brassicaformis CCMP3155]|uniref:Uncharacterized protein n=2 Tax=Vitrella brassicaformis TaxID=1169539 RepID=A0A0G4FND9_VITBC|nr:unnamed protein product [Vitrella brassicaformis CCMP3155]|eukprot:CEM15765.1 unnamed protein product [Vitrella brassicaformis CCMP3155]
MQRLLCCTLAAEAQISNTPFHVEEETTPKTPKKTKASSLNWARAADVPMKDGRVSASHVHDGVTIVKRGFLRGGRPPRAEMTGALGCEAEELTGNEAQTLTPTHNTQTTPHLPQPHMMSHLPHNSIIPHLQPNTEDDMLDIDVDHDHDNDRDNDNNMPSHPFPQPGDGSQGDGDGDHNPGDNCLVNNEGLHQQHQQQHQQQGGDGGAANNVNNQDDEIMTEVDPEEMQLLDDVEDEAAAAAAAAEREGYEGFPSPEPAIPPAAEYESNRARLAVVTAEVAAMEVELALLIHAHENQKLHDHDDLTRWRQEALSIELAREVRELDDAAEMARLRDDKEREERAGGDIAVAVDGIDKEIEAVREEEARIQAEQEELDRLIEAEKARTAELNRDLHFESAREHELTAQRQKDAEEERERQRDPHYLLSLICGGRGQSSSACGQAVGVDGSGDGPQDTLEYEMLHGLAQHFRSRSAVAPPPHPNPHPPHPSAVPAPHLPLPTPPMPAMRQAVNPHYAHFHHPYANGPPIPDLPPLQPPLPKAAAALNGNGSDEAPQQGVAHEAGELNGVMPMHHGGAAGMGAMGGQFHPLAGAFAPAAGHYGMPPLMPQGQYRPVGAAPASPSPSPSPSLDASPPTHPYRPVQHASPAQDGFPDAKTNGGPPVPFWGVPGGVGDQPAPQAAAGSPRMVPTMFQPPAAHMNPWGGAYAAAVPHHHQHQHQHQQQYQYQYHPAAAHGGGAIGVGVPFGQGSPPFLPSDSDAQEQPGGASASAASQGSSSPHNYGAAAAATGGGSATGSRNRSRQIPNMSASPKVRHGEMNQQHHQQQQQQIPVPPSAGSVPMPPFGVLPVAHNGMPPPAAAAAAAVANDPFMPGYPPQQSVASPSAAHDQTAHGHHHHHHHHWVGGEGQAPAPAAADDGREGPGAGADPSSSAGAAGPGYWGPQHYPQEQLQQQVHQQQQQQQRQRQGSDGAGGVDGEGGGYAGGGVLYYRSS